MKKEILDRGYVTHALTNTKGEIYGLNPEHYINFDINPVERENTFYWSEIYRESNMAIIIRKGQLLVNPTASELQDYFIQSKVNLAI